MSSAIDCKLSFILDKRDVLWYDEVGVKILNGVR